MGRFVIIDTATKAVLNVAVYNEHPGNPPPGYGANATAVEHAKAGTDWAWNGTSLAAPAVPPIEALPEHVKREARGRILSLYPEWKQANMTARGVELTLVVAQGQQWNAQEQTEAAALKGAWGWIKEVRAASDALETMSPIPLDYKDDKWWP